MTASQSFRGPDGQDTWVGDAAGLGHTLLRTTFELTDEHQPRSLDGRIWIAADARIDGQRELKKKLVGLGRSGLETASDCELILHAYHAWDADCILHLLGDFAFAIWDGPRRTLFCARDPFGVKPFFYALAGQQLVFSNTLACVRMHPAVSRKLDDLAIADFLLFETNLDPAGTAFKDIRRLPPGHSLTCTTDGLVVKRYWSLPYALGVCYRASGDYVEHFKALLEQSINDRLRIDQVAIEMSGGLDSTSVAALAQRLLAARPRPFQMHAFTLVYDHLIADQERYYAGLAAKHLGIPIDYFRADDYPLYGFRQAANSLPEPLHDPLIQSFFDSISPLAAFSRVALTGWDGDALLSESPKPYFRVLLKEHRYLRLLQYMARYALSQRRLMPLGLRAWLARKKSGAATPTPEFPVWIHPDLDKRFDLRARWTAFHNRAPHKHPIRPHAYRCYQYMLGQSSFFDQFDAGLHRQPIEYRHPMLDLRLIEYCLSLPPLPWCVKKEILRMATKGLLPDLVRFRPKTPLAGFPYLELLRRQDMQWVDSFQASPLMDNYVLDAMIPAVWSSSDADAAWLHLRPLSLNFWLTSQGIRDDEFN